MTVHGPGYGLDEDEAFESQLAGFLDAIDSSDVPEQLKSITFVEQNRGRAKRLKRSLDQIIHGGALNYDDQAWREAVGPEASERIRAVGYSSASKAHVFVAMPFSEDMDDVYHYGIRNAVKTAGLLCEDRGADREASSFTKRRCYGVGSQKNITAALVVADLTEANPNVYLEVGFAWGCGIPTVLLAKEASELRFDTRGQRCLTYSKIKELEETAALVVADLTEANPNVYLEVGFAWGCGIPTVLLAKEASELRFDTRGQRCLTYSKIKELEEKLAVELKSLNGV